MAALSAARIEVDDVGAAQELLLQRGWTDGLPIVPPTPELVEHALSFTDLEPGEVIGSVPERRRSITVEKVAINAVMAGCRSEYLPVVIAAIEAMCDPLSGPHGPTASTAGAGLMLIINGPPVQQFGINVGGNVLGPGVRSNATIGRAIRLIVMNCTGAYPGQADRSTLGHAGKYSWCIGEDERDCRWIPLHVERGLSSGDGAVTTFWGLSTVQVSEHRSADPKGIVAAFAQVMGSVDPEGARGRQVVLLIAGEHRNTLAGAGWSKSDVRDYLYECLPNGFLAVPDDCLVVSAGGSGGRFAAFSLSWGVRSMHEAVTRSVGSCVACA